MILTPMPLMKPLGNLKGWILACAGMTGYGEIARHRDSGSSVFHGAIASGFVGVRKLTPTYAG
jgi:hypothetical protein